MLHVKGLNAGYGNIQVLRDIALEVTEGEVICLIGSNGAGKSTTMGALSGLLRPVSGSIKFEDEAIERFPAERIVSRGICLVPEGRRVFQPLTVLENLEMGAYRRRREGGRQIRQDLDLIYDIFPRLKERRDQPAGTLSGGEQQMLAIGRALMSQPRLLMLDEPSMGLAPLIVAEIFSVIGKLNKQGITILLAEQNARKALEVSSRGYVLQSGEIVLAADSDTLEADEAVREAYLGI
jgi:branched-chain amino acid transport system ATP-binding protein